VFKFDVDLGLDFVICVFVNILFVVSVNLDCFVFLSLTFVVLHLVALVINRESG